MRLLLDTQALLWWLDDPRLGPATRGLIEAPANDVLVSVVTLWEIVVKVRIGKLEFDLGALPTVVTGEGFTPLAITPQHLLKLGGLPIHHRDPFDHLLIAQAAAEDATFVSEDANTARYAVRHMPCSDARAR